MFALADFPAVRPGEDLAGLIAAYGPQAGDVIVIAQKVVSKAEGRIVELESVTPSARAHELAEQTGKDVRVVELVLRESTKVLRARPGLMIVEHRLGYIMANAGIDASNVGAADQVILLPEDADRSARDLVADIRANTGTEVGVVISDSWGRPWRLGTVGFAIGLAGIPAVVDMCGRPDLDGRPLQATVIGRGDELATAASLLMGQADEGKPVVVIRGLDPSIGEGRAADLIRPVEDDLFRQGGDGK